MNQNYFSNPKNTFTTKISGNRTHFSMRPKYITRSLRIYASRQGDTMYSLGESFLKSESKWDIIADTNIPLKADNLAPNTEIIVPLYVIETDDKGVKVL